MKTYGFRTKGTAQSVPFRFNRFEVTKRRDTTDVTDSGSVPDGSLSPRRERITGIEEVEIRFTGFMDTDSSVEADVDWENEAGVTFQLWPHGQDFAADTYTNCLVDELVKRTGDPAQPNTFEGHAFCSNWDMQS